MEIRIIPERELNETWSCSHGHFSLARGNGTPEREGVNKTGNHVSYLRGQRSREENSANER